MGNPSTYRLDFSKGLNEFYESSSLPEGYATQVRNWIPEENGALRIPRAWETGSAEDFTGNRTARGLGYFVPAQGAQYIMAQDSTGTEYKLWALPKVNIDNGTWFNFDTVTVAESTTPVALAAGAGKLLHCNPGYPSAYILSWDGTTTTNIPTSLAGRALIYHNNRFFVGGSTLEPTVQRWSELGDATTWTTSTNYQPIGDDDGEPIEDFCSWDRGLFIAKENSIWYMSGFGPDTFSWRKMDGGGVAPGRTLVPTPQGIIAVGQGRVFSFTGGGFEPISQPIETHYGMTGDYMSGAYIDGVVYVCDEGSGTVWRYELKTQAWAMQDLDEVNEGPNMVFAQGRYLLGGAKEAAANSILLYRAEPGGFRHMPVGSGQTYVAATGDMFLSGPSKPYTVLQLDLILRQRGGDESEDPLTVNVYAEDGTLTMSKPIGPFPGSGVYRERMSIGRAGRFATKIELTQTLTAYESAQFDIEYAAIEVEEDEPR